MLKRRDFLTSCAAGSVALATPFTLAGTDDLARSLSGGRSAMNAENCRSLLQEMFRCTPAGDGELSLLRLVEVRPGPQVPGLEQFALVFENPEGEPVELKDGLYTLYHPQTGKSLLHMATSDSEKSRYVSYLGNFS